MNGTGELRLDEGVLRAMPFFQTRAVDTRTLSEWQADEKREWTDLELLELSTLLPAACQLSFHALDGDETYIRILWSSTDDRSHRRNRWIGG